MPINKNGTTGKRDETMGYVKWSYETLNHFCGDVFKAFGFTEEESNQIKYVLLTEMCIRDRYKDYACLR